MEIEKPKEAPSKAKPGRPRSEEKRTAILHAGAGLFFDKGLDRTSMDAVAQHAGVSKQTVYSHFSSKEDLLEACIRSKLDSYELQGSRALEQIGVREGLTTLCLRFISLLYDENVLRMKRTVMGSATAHPEVAKLFFEAGPLATLDTFKAFIHHHVAAGALVVDDVHEAADMLSGMLASNTHMGSVLGASEPLDEPSRRRRVESCVAMFLSRYAAQ
ncbi:MAG: TetR/AcrR family transcriptional regulator [Pseudomonadota bacterium]